MNLFRRLWNCITDPTFGQVPPPIIIPATVPNTRYYGWISVRNQMPDTSHDQILIFNGRYPRCGKCLADKHGNKAFYSPHDEKLSGITYWAYIPTLPSPQEGTTIDAS